ncbi:Fruit protein [Chlorella vulgaris]
MSAAAAVRMPVMAASRAVAASKSAVRAAAATLPLRHRALRAVATPRNLRQRGSSLIVYAHWGAPVEFKAGKVVSNEKEAEKQQRLMVQMGDGASLYTTAGQYIQAKFGEEGKAGYFAIASPPGADKENGLVELLVKEQEGANHQLCTAQAGASLLVSAPLGKGFAVDTVPPAQFPTVLVFATGTGISPIKALIESGTLQVKQRKDVRVYYGVRSKDWVAFADSIPQWEAAGVKVIPVYSEQGGGYVQDAFAKELDGVDWAGGVAAVLCGQKDMAVTITELLTSKGVAKEHILSNF